MTEINTQKGSFLLVPVPEGARNIEHSVQDDGVPCITYWYGENLDPSVVSLPPGSYSLVGVWPDGMSEEQCASVVESIPYKNSDNEGFEYLDYTEEKILLCDKWIWNIVFKSATESFRSLIVSTGIPITNKYGEKPQEPLLMSRHMTRDEMIIAGDKYLSDLNQWQSEEKKLVKRIAVLKSNGA